MTEKEILEKQIEDAKSKLKELEEKEKNSERNEALRKLSEVTDEEKITFFDRMYKSALSELKEVVKTGYHNEDYPHYAWESYIQILARDTDKFWKYWNKIRK